MEKGREGNYDKYGLHGTQRTTTDAEDDNDNDKRGWKSVRLLIVHGRMVLHQCSNESMRRRGSSKGVCTAEGCGMACVSKIRRHNKSVDGP